MESDRHVWALDFDGVICDSCGESSLSAWRAAVSLWPAVFDTPEAAAQKEELLEKMRAVRPVVETGYENIIQIRALLEGTQVDDMLENWGTMLPAKMEEWSLQRSDMVELFGSTRDQWMADDLDGWLAPNRIYDGVADAMKAAIADSNSEVYIVTTKQARFTQILLKQMAGIEFPMERIFSQTVSGKPKTEVLEMLMQRHAGHDLHFVEDKLATLIKVQRVPALDAWKLYLVDWGYNTASEKEFASADSRIALIGPGAFRLLLDQQESLTM